MNNKLFIFVIVFFLVVCFSSAQVEGSTIDVSGLWNGTWSSGFIGPGQPAQGNISITFIQSGTNLSGQVSIFGNIWCNIITYSLSGTVFMESGGHYLEFNTPPRTCSNGYLREFRFSSNGDITGNKIFGYLEVYSYNNNVGIASYYITRSVNTIQANARSGGNIFPSGQVSVSAGGNQTFIIEPDPGYKIKDVVVDGVSVGAKTSYTFSTISFNHTITATFALKTSTEAAIIPILPLLLND